MSRRPTTNGLFNGYWTTLDGTKIRRIRRNEYPELYRLYREYRDIRLGVRPFGMRMGGE